MSADWYFAECKKCMEVKYFFVDSPAYSAKMFQDKNEEIYAWFQKHYGCELTLGWRDDHLDALWEQGYTNNDLR